MFHKILTYVPMTVTPPWCNSLFSLKILLGPNSLFSDCLESFLFPWFFNLGRVCILHMPELTWDG